MRIPMTLITLLSLVLFSCGDSPTGPEPDPDTDEPAVTTGTLEVTTETTGNGTDEDGYTVSVGSDRSSDIGTDETVTFEDLEEGSRAVELEGLAAGCSVEGDNPIQADITAEETTSVTFTVQCQVSKAEGIIVFSKRVDGRYQIYTMNADGSDTLRITDNNSQDSWPSISPDGTRIAFARQDMESSSLDNEIWVMNIDGSSQARLTDNPVMDIRPAWSPDGTQIVWQSDSGESISVYLMNDDGTGEVPLTDDEGNDHSPTWSPEGIIAFVSDRQGDSSSDIYRMQPDGSELEVLVDAGDDNGINLFEPAWSPDGSQIAYQGYGPLGGPRIFVAEADGSGAFGVTSDDVGAYQPSWSPDAEYIAFTNLSDGSTTDSIWIVSVDGSLEVRLTDNEDTYSAFPAWGVAVD